MSLVLNFATLLTTSLGITAALSWNDAIKSLFVKGGTFEEVGARGVWVTAILVTLLAFFATLMYAKAYPAVPMPQKPNPIRIE